MNAKFLVAACAAATGLFAAQAMAANVGVNPGTTVIAAGASALRLSFGNATFDLCDLAAGAPNRPIEFRDSAAGTSRRAYVCTVKAGVTGVPAGTRILVHKRDSGGSIQGVFPVSRSIPIARMNLGVTPYNFDDGTGVGLPAGCSLSTLAIFYPAPQVAPSANIVPVICSGTTTDVAPEAGLSDVEPELFRGVNKESAADPDWGKAPGDATVVVDRQIGAQGFGVAVSKNLYDELQAVQGLNGADDLPGPNQPSIKAGQITAMLKGTSQNWSDHFATITGAVKVCRRVAGSGTQATSNALFLQNPCLPTAANPADNTNDANPNNNTPATAGSQVATGGNYTVVMNSGSGDVITCLTTAHTQGDKAFGWLSYENRVASDATNWRFVKLDGVSGNHDVDADSPTAGVQAENFTDNVVNGGYEGTFEFVSLRRNLGAAKNALWDAIIARLKTPVNLYRTNAADGDFLPGLAAHILSGFTPAPGGTDQPVMRATRNGDSCSPLEQFLPVNPTGGE